MTPRPCPIKFSMTDISDIINSLCDFVAVDAWCNRMAKLSATKAQSKPYLFTVEYNPGVGADAGNAFCLIGDNIDKFLQNPVLAVSFNQKYEYFMDTWNNGCDVLYMIDRNVTVQDFTMIDPSGQFCIRLNTNRISANPAQNCVKKLQETCGQPLSYFGDVLYTVTGMGGMFQKYSYIPRPVANSDIMDMVFRVLMDRKISDCRIPFLAKLVENIRQFLVRVLLQNHWSEINASVTVADAQKFLKGNKDEIFKYAERFGYIPDSSVLIKYQGIRDILAHPVQTDAEHFFTDCTGIISDFVRVAKHLTHSTDSIVQVMQNPIPDIRQICDKLMFGRVFENVDKLNNVLTQMPIVEANKTPNQKIKKMYQTGNITQSQYDCLDTAIRVRNSVLHGNRIDMAALKSIDARLLEMLTYSLSYQANTHVLNTLLTHYRGRAHG